MFETDLIVDFQWFMIWTTLASKTLVLEWVVSSFLKFDQIVSTAMCQTEQDRTSTIILLLQRPRLLLPIEIVPVWIKFLIETRDQNQFHQCALGVTHL